MLPRDISRGELVATLRGFAGALGVRCVAKPPLTLPELLLGTIESGGVPAAIATKSLEAVRAKIGK